MERLTSVKIKIMNIMRSFLIPAILGFILVSCGEDEGTEPTGASVTLQFNPVNTASSVSAGRLEANTLAFTSGTIRLTQIQFEAETDSDSIEVDIEQVVEIDFATGETTPNLDHLTFPAGTYNEVEVELELLDENSTPSIVIEGTYTDANDQTHPIRFEFNSGETFEVEKEGQIVIAEGTSVIAEIEFDPGVWFAGVTREELSQATKNNDGVIVISENSNAEIFDIVADGLDVATEVEITL